ncbi:MAG: hypothetical protein AAF433_19695 [Bacteroidota bacterium]
MHRFVALALPFFALSLALCLPFSSQAQDEFSTQSVTVFKNGTAFYHQRAELPVDGRMIHDIPLPSVASTELDPSGQPISRPIRAKLGTATFLSDDNDIVSYWTSRKATEAERRFAGPRELFQANIGKTISLRTRQGESISGEISAIQSIQQSSTSLGLSSSHLLLKTATTYHLVALADISSFELANDALTQPLAAVSTQPTHLSLELDRPTRSAEIDLTFLTDGLSWVPQYKVELLGDQRLNLQLFATILNDQADLENIQLQLAVGQPQYIFSHIADPFFNRGGVASFLQQLSGRNRGFTQDMNQMSNVITSQRAAYMMEAEMPQVRSSLNDADLYFFGISDFSLGRGQTANVRLLEQEVEYEDKYTCNLGTREGPGNTYRVWHELCFKNSSEHPLTTGMILYYSRNDEQYEPIGQQQLDFIPPGGDGQVKMSIATEIFVDQEERVGNRQYAERFSRHYRDHTITVKLNNFKDKPATIRLRRSVNGYLLSSEVDPRNISDGILGESNNQNNNYEWELELTAGEERELQMVLRIWN